MIGVIYDEKAKRIIAILKGFTCSWNKCTFCCFYEEAAKDINDLISTNKEIITKIKDLMNEKSVDKISLFNGGSFFELPLSVIYDLSNITNNKIIEIESRPEFLNENSIKYLYNLLKPSKLIVRIGFESIYDNIRNGLLNKGIKDSELRRILELRNEIKNKFGSLIEFIAYVLFGIEGIDEKSVITSIEEFNKSLDGVIAIKYRKYHEWMPKEVKVSKGLLEFLRMNCLDVDLTESNIWKIGFCQ
ncbi:MAG: hypothetical protein QW193_04595 [Nitrososphaerales archaeon]